MILDNVHHLVPYMCVACAKLSLILQFQQCKRLSIGGPFYTCGQRRRSREGMIWDFSWDNMILFVSIGNSLKWQVICIMTFSVAQWDIWDDSFASWNVRGRCYLAYQWQLLCVYIKRKIFLSIRLSGVIWVHFRWSCRQDKTLISALVCLVIWGDTNCEVVWSLV